MTRATSVVVVYHSASGRTRTLAEAVSRGAASASDDGAISAHVLSVEEASRAQALLAAADAIVFGCPTYMGSASAAFKGFMDSTVAVWALQGWRDKLAAGFTHSAAPSGDKLGTLTQLAVFAAQHGMVWIGLGLPPTYAAADRPDDDTNRLGSHLGAMAQSRPGGGVLPVSDVKTAEHLGRRVAEAALRWGASASAAADASTARHPTTRSWVFPPPSRPALGTGIERTNLRELVARSTRHEHQLMVCATVDGVQLEVTTASEPLYFGHINLSDEYALALPTGDDLVDRFPLRTFLSDLATGEDVGRYNHRIGDLVLHPEGYAALAGAAACAVRAVRLPARHAPLRAEYRVLCKHCHARDVVHRCRGRRVAKKTRRPTSRPRRRWCSRRFAASLACSRASDAPRSRSSSCPTAIAPPHGGWVVVLEAMPDERPRGVRSAAHRERLDARRQGHRACARPRVG